MRPPFFLPAFIFLAASPLRAQLPQYDHIVIVVEENHAAASILGNFSDAPFINSLAARGVSLTNMAAITHPSQPNYLELFSASAQGVFDNEKPSPLPFTTPNLASALRAAGKTFIGYSQGLPAYGDATTVSTVRDGGVEVYARKHVPWTNWQSSAQPQPANTLPPSVNVPFTLFPRDFNTLPGVAFVIPDQDHDMHNGGPNPIATGDRWLKKHLAAYADWAEQHNSLLIVTWDEDDYSANNRIATIFVGAHLRPGSNAGGWTLHHLLRTLTDLNGIAPLGKTAGISRIKGTFAGEMPVATRTFRNGAGYRGTHDTFLSKKFPDRSFGGKQFGHIFASGAETSQTLVRFDDIFGGAPGQLPAAATLLSGTLRMVSWFYGFDGSPDPVTVRRMREAFSEDSTWNSFADGVNADDVEADSRVEFSAFPQNSPFMIFDVGSTVRDWASGAPNHGWLLEIGGGDFAYVYLSEPASPREVRPALEITFEASEIAFAAARVKVAENAASVTLTVHRTGATNAPAACAFATIDGTARAGKDYTAVQGTLTWPADDATDRTIVVPILSDAKTESGETFSVKLRAPAGIASFGAVRKAVVVIKGN